MKCFRFVIQVVVLCGFCTSHTVAGAEVELSAALMKLTRQYFNKQQSPGLSVGVIYDGEVLLMEGMGSADLENDVPATSKTVYRVGSITKQFTAAAIMQLASEGKLNIDDELAVYLEKAPEDWLVRRQLVSAAEHWRGVTIRNLLNHTSGIPSYTSMEEFKRSYRLDLSQEQMLEMIRHQPVQFKPGQAWAYSNSGYCLLGLIIEVVSGKPYEQYLADSFFAPLAMDSTFYCDHRTVINRRASGYEKEDEKWLNADMLSMRTPFAAGALCSSVEDLAKWSVALVDGKAIPREYYLKMITPDKLNSGMALTYGYGLGIVNIEGHKMIGHGGVINGFTAGMSRFDNEKLHIIILTNSGGASPKDLDFKLAKTVLAQHRGEGNDWMAPFRSQLPGWSDE